MDYQTLLVEVGDDHIGTITLNRPEQLNTFDDMMARELDQAVWALEADPRVRAVIVKGAGKAFCAGIDIRAFAGKTACEYKDWAERMEKALQSIMTIGKPVVAQVHGVAAANGAGLVAASDLAVASEDAKIGYTAINVGLFCLGPAVPLSRVAGRKHALEFLLFGDLVPARRAYEMGHLNMVVPPAELETAARQYARRLAAKSPVALQLGKKACYVTGDMELHQAFEYMNEAFARLCTTQDAQEGVSAFLEKREPKWRGC